MRRKISNLSVSKKTLLLLLVFVLMPLMIGGWSILEKMNQRADNLEMDSVIQRCRYASEMISGHLDTVKQIADRLSVHEAINDVVVRNGESMRHYESNEVMLSILEYNDYLIKIQLLSDGKVVWQYGGKKRYVFGEDGNEEYAAVIDQNKKVSFWSPAHVFYQLRAGRFDEEVQLVSFYSGIHETKSMQQNGVLALHLTEESICELYWNYLYGDPLEAWIVMGEGELFSATEKEWLKTGVPEDLQIFADEETEGVIRANYKGKKVQLFWQQCGDWDCYLVQMNEDKGVLHTYAAFIILVFLMLLLMGIGYMHFYKIFVADPLEALTGQMKRARDLDLRQESLPARGDEIGVLTTTFQSMLSHIDELIEKVYVEKIKTQEAEQEMMLSQINPHFLYNTLDSIRWNALSHGDKETAKQMEALSLMLRNTLNFGKVDTTIAQEMQIIENYCYLLQVRFRKEIEVVIEVDPLVTGYHIPKLLIQPLVENAYKHGLENKKGLKKIWVKVRRVQKRLVIYVADNGLGCDRNTILHKIAEGSGKECFALRNIRDRIHLTYGTAGIFHFSSWRGIGTIVKIILPLDKNRIEESER